ncbi:MAG: chemotaxis response regulator protein-glutamate methylesterase [Desulfovibrionaceae bacterium]|nr:chemotaxis response regulator protein-glutamate methylesterase [Desulfovibrionaceae bacterium]
MIKVLIVDDSIFIRNTLVKILQKSPRINVVATARDGEEALKLIAVHDPDVVTLDIEMPRMDGLTALKRIMAEMPRAVLMISSLTTEGAEATLKALELGAVDFITKQTLPTEGYEKEIHETIISVARRTPILKNLRRLKPAAPVKPAAPAVNAPERQLPRSTVPVRDVVAIGVSTGGPPAVQKLLAALPKNFPACILIAQHMPAAFTATFAKRLDAISQLSVKEAESGDRLKSGWAFVAPGGKHLRVKPSLELEVSEEPVSALYKPSANELMDSVGKVFGRKALGVMLTGMGNDGVVGAKTLKDSGGRMLAQNEQSCVVYGMPKAVVDAGLADEVLDIDDMAKAIMDNLYIR